MRYSKSVSRYRAYDVVVAGGGPAGFGATVAAARNGLKTLLIEGNGCIGGTCTAGALPFILGATTGSIPFPQMIKQGLRYKDLPHPRKAVGGVYDRFIACVKAQNGGVGPQQLAQTDKYPGLDRLGCHDEFTFDLEIGKRVMDEMVLAAGADILYYTHVLCAEIKQNRAEGVYISNKSGVQFVPCKAIIDCTGDADLVSRAGYRTYKGDRETGEMTGAGLVAHIENINAEAIERYLNEGNDPWFREICRTAAAAYTGPLHDLPTSLILFPMMQDGVFMVNGGTSRAGIDGTNGDDLTLLTLWGRQRARYLVEHLFRNYMPGAKHCRLRSTASYPGIRETRRIVGEYMLTEEDLLSGRRFSDTIALAGRHFDLARSNAKDGVIQEFAEKYVRAKGGVTPIPYRALIPENSNDILAAGRCISADGQALGPARIMSTCMAVGEAAGTAAYYKLKQNVAFKDIDINALRENLRKNGAEIDA